MKNTKVLEMINSGELENLKALLQDEIYSDNLKNVSGAKQRYSAMKRYFKYGESGLAENMQKPCKVAHDGTEHHSFLNGYSFVLTTEGVGEIEEFDTEKNTYFKIESLISLNDCKIEKLNINDIIARAKAEGYKYKKDELGNTQNFTTVFCYKDAYYKVGILEQTYSIINDNEEAEVYYSGKINSPLFIKTSIGLACILPVNESNTMNKTIIYVDSKEKAA